MAAVVGFAGLAAASLYLREHRETTAIEVVEREEYLLLVCLIVGDKYGFHVNMGLSPRPPQGEEAFSHRGDKDFFSLFIFSVPPKSPSLGGVREGLFLLSLLTLDH